MCVIEIPDEQAAALRARAAAEGLTLEGWLARMAEEQQRLENARPGTLGHVAHWIVNYMKDVPPEIAASMPSDGAAEHDHYIYGTPKRGNCLRGLPTPSIGSPLLMLPTPVTTGQWR